MSGHLCVFEVAFGAKDLQTPGSLSPIFWKFEVHMVSDALVFLEGV